MHKLIFLFVFFTVHLHVLWAQISIHIASLPANTPEGASIYFAGNINNWNPGDSDFELQIKNDGDYWIELPAGSGEIEFKFTRGNWETVEGNESGNYIPNRSYTYGNGDTLDLNILGWEDLTGGNEGNSTANEQVFILDEAFGMPQLNRKRRIWIYLPQDYDTSQKSYPVLYMHDGQNVFDAGTSFAGEWKVDETLTKLENEGYFGIIVVAVDNGGSHRIDEYSPFLNSQYGGGEGDEYLEFLVETLKPHIDSLYRTLKSAVHTGIMGSSMGGLISHYAHFSHPDVFGRAGIFSPSYWFSQDYFDHTIEKGKTEGAKLYLLAGAKENTIAVSTQEMYDLLVQTGYSQDEIKLLIQADGEHSEWFWAREFEDALLWLFPNEVYDTTGTDSKPDILIFPNPTKDSVKVVGKGLMDVSVYSLNGRLIKKQKITDSGIIDLSAEDRKGQLIIAVEGSAGEVVQMVLTF